MHEGASILLTEDRNTQTLELFGDRVKESSFHFDATTLLQIRALSQQQPPQPKLTLVGQISVELGGVWSQIGSTLGFISAGIIFGARIR